MDNGYVFHIMCGSQGQEKTPASASSPQFREKQKARAREYRRLT
jgi:hypothetical protein